MLYFKMTLAKRKTNPGEKCKDLVQAVKSPQHPEEFAVWIWLVPVLSSLE